MQEIWQSDAGGSIAMFSKEYEKTKSSGPLKQIVRIVEKELKDQTIGKWVGLPQAEKKQRFVALQGTKEWAQGELSSLQVVAPTGAEADRLLSALDAVGEHFGGGGGGASAARIPNVFDEAQARRTQDATVFQADDLVGSDGFDLD